MITFLMYGAKAWENWETVFSHDIYFIFVAKAQNLNYVFLCLWFPIENLKHNEMLDPLGQAWQSGSALAA